MCIDKFYIMSKDLGGGPYFLGILTRKETSYSFIYEEGITKEYEIPGLPITKRVHLGDSVKTHLIHRIVPEPTHMFIEGFLSQEGMGKYDEWILLNYLWHRFRRNNKQTKYPLHDRKQRTYFYDTLPGRYHVLS